MSDQGASRNSGQPLESASEKERLTRYRQFAEEALEKAREAGNADLRAGFLTMAAGWHSLAYEIERSARTEKTGGPEIPGSGAETKAY